MDGSIKIARVFGIPLRIHSSWLIVFVLLAWSLATGYFPRVRPGLELPTLIALGVSAAILFFAALFLHELAHSYVAIREGLPVRSITLFVFGGVAQMSGEPRSAGAEFRMAIAGPLTSIAVGLIFGTLAWGLARASLAPELRLLFQYLAFINVAVAGFNMLPAFPLDGGRVFRSAVWYVTRNRLRATRIASAVGQGFAYVMIGIGALQVFAGNVAGGLWIAFIGWFLLQAAEASYQQALIRRALRGIEARDVMRRQIEAVPANIPLTEFVERYLMQGRESEFCVTEGSRLRGVISLQDVKRVPREQWAGVRVEQAMTQEDACPTVRASQSAYEALLLLGREGATQVIVRENGRMVGAINRGDLLGFIRNRLELES